MVIGQLASANAISIPSAALIGDTHHMPGGKAAVDYSQVESDRFGLRIFRSTADDIQPDELLTALLENRVDILFLRIPSHRQTDVARLDEIGVPYLTADSLAYYDADLTDPPTPLRNPDLVLRPLTVADRGRLKAMVETVFPGYTNHYASNPLLDSSDILDGYAEWAGSYVDAPGRTTFFAEIDSEPVAFVTSSYAGDECEAVLVGVMPDAAGRGVYTDSIRLTQMHYRQRGMQRITVSTQIQNVAVQRAWARTGFTLRKSLSTVHLNALLDASVQEPYELDHELDAASGSVNAFGDVVSRYFATQFPGPGSTVVRRRTAILNDLHPGRTYRLRIAFPVGSADGHYTATVTAYDEGLCFLAYYDIVKDNR